MCYHSREYEEGTWGPITCISLKNSWDRLNHEESRIRDSSSWGTKIKS